MSLCFQLWVANVGERRQAKHSTADRAADTGSDDSEAWVLDQNYWRLQSGHHQARQLDSVAIEQPMMLKHVASGVRYGFVLG